MSLPDVWTSRWPGYTGTVWYRITWERCAEVPVALEFDYLNMAGAVYLNGHLLWRDASLAEPLSRSWNVPRYMLLPDTGTHPGMNTLTLAVVGLADYSPGLGTARLGAPPDIYPHYVHERVLRNLLPFVNVTASFILGMFFFVLWLMWRNERTFGWFALTSLAWWVYALNMLVTSPWPFSTTDGWERMMSLAFVAFASSFIMFLWRFLGQRWPRWETALWCFTALQGIALIVADAAHLGVVRAILAIIPSALFIAGCLQVIVVAIKGPRGDGVVALAICMVALIGLGFHDLLVFLGVLHSNLYYTTLGVQGLAIVLALVLAGRFARSMRRIEGFKQELEQTIEHTRADLRRTLEREQALEIANAHMTGRLALARDLHDGLGGTLVGAIARMEHGETASTSAQWLALLKDLRDDLRQVIDVNTSHAAPIPATPEAWLAPLRSRYGRMFEEQGILPVWQLPTTWPWVPQPLQAIALTRFLQEACTNVLKHSQARRVRVSLDTTPTNNLRLSIEDDGVGFEVAHAWQTPGGTGLASMTDRMQRIGATLDIRSTAGTTRLVVQLPGATQAQAMVDEGIAPQDKSDTKYPETTDYTIHPHAPD